MREIWDAIFLVSSRNINIENPYLFGWIYLKLMKYERIIHRKFSKKFEYECRNNQEIRNLFIDIVTIMTLSKKNKRLVNMPKVSGNDFKMENIANKRIAKRHIKNVMESNEDKDLFLALSEINTHLEQKITKMEDLLYWFLWIDKMEKYKRKNNCEFYVKKRKKKEIDEKYWDDWRWILWDIIFLNIRDENQKKQIEAIYKIYKWKHRIKNIINRDYLIFCAFLMIKSDVDWKTPLIEKYEYRVQACCNVNQLYKLKKFDNIKKIDGKKENEKKEEKKEENKEKLANNNRAQMQQPPPQPQLQPQPEIKVETEKKAKKYKVKEKKNKSDEEREKKEAIMMEKMDIFNKIFVPKRILDD